MTYRTNRASVVQSVLSALALTGVLLASATASAQEAAPRTPASKGLTQVQKAHVTSKLKQGTVQADKKKEPAAENAKPVKKKPVPRSTTRVTKKPAKPVKNWP